ncbi:hypothetical protein PanWU01x14_184510, partial [Parasponia andersonii]
KWVSFDRVNKFHRLLDIDDDGYSKLWEDGIDPEAIIQFLTYPNMRWKRSQTDVINFPTTGLQRNANVMYYFISPKLLPSRNYCAVTKERVVLNYFILKGLIIDVGETTISYYCIPSWEKLEHLQQDAAEPPQAAGPSAHR